MLGSPHTDTLAASSFSANLDAPSLCTIAHARMNSGTIIAMTMILSDFSQTASAVRTKSHFRGKIRTNQSRGAEQKVRPSKSTESGALSGPGMFGCTVIHTQAKIVARQLDTMPTSVLQLLISLQTLVEESEAVATFRIGDGVAVGKTETTMVEVQTAGT